MADAALSLLRTQVWLGLPAFAIFSIVAPDIFALVFGEAWRSSGHYAQLLMPYMFLTFISLPLNALPIAFDKQQGELFFQAGMAVARCAALLVGSALGGVELTMALLSMVGAAGWLLYLLWTMSLVNHRPGRVLQDLAREALFSVPFILPLGLAKMLMDTGGSGWLMAIATLCWLASLAVVAVRAMPALGVSNISLAGSVTPSS